jgi:alcohol dehydrogenase (cytochrome c)
VLDRASGEFLRATPFAKVTWATGVDDTGRPTGRVDVTTEGVILYPNNQGATNWYNPSYSPRTGLFYIPTWLDTYSRYFSRRDEYVEGNQYTGGGASHDVPALNPRRTNTRPLDFGTGAIQAVDPLTGDVRWQFRMTDVTDSGVLSTASGLVFAGGREGYFYALDASTGAVLWKAMVGGSIAAGPVTYAVDGRQYVSVPAGSALFTWALE